MRRSPKEKHVDSMTKPYRISESKLTPYETEQFNDAERRLGKYRMPDGENFNVEIWKLMRQILNSQEIHLELYNEDGDWTHQDIHSLIQTAILTSTQIELAQSNRISHDLIREIATRLTKRIMILTTNLLDQAREEMFESASRGETCGFHD